MKAHGGKFVRLKLPHFHARPPT